ncbi:hypothetical protein BH11PLA1_BH11PLA1_18920 [soil metagenome]
MAATPNFELIEPARPVLFVFATAREACGAIREIAEADEGDFESWRAVPLGENDASRIDVLVTGVGKANAAAAAARALDPARHGLIVSAGIGGVYPAAHARGLALGDVVAASACVFADEGVESDTGFMDLAALGFGPMTGAASPARRDANTMWDGSRCVPCAGALDLFIRSGCKAAEVATVSTCAGTDARAADMERRSACAVEAMEGAAVALVAARLGVPFAEVRAISNTTGARARQVWRVGPALEALARVLGRAHASGWRVRPR